MTGGGVPRSYAWGLPASVMPLAEVRRRAVEDVQADRGGVAVVAAAWGIYSEDLAQWVADAASTEPPPGGPHGGGEAA